MLDRIEKWFEEKMSGKYYVRDFVKGFSFAMVVELLLSSLILCVVTLSPRWLILNIISPVLVGIINMLD